MRQLATRLLVVLFVGTVEKKNFSVGIGAGATRLFVGNLAGVSTTIPTLRFVNIGWSF